MDNKILIINGPNLEMLGKRKESVYGNFTLKDLENELLKDCLLYTSDAADE